jgi:hypothetical protein
MQRTWCDIIKDWELALSNWRDSLLLFPSPINYDAWQQEYKQFVKAKEELMTIQDTLDERKNTHGDFAENARLSRTLKEVMYVTPGWHALTHVQREALDVIQAKIARILSGNPDEEDHWRDICGYSELARQNIISNMPVHTPPPIPSLSPASNFCHCEKCEAVRKRMEETIREASVGAYSKED